MSNTVTIEPAVPVGGGSSAVVIPLALAVGTALWVAVRAAIGTEEECRPWIEGGREELRRQRLATLELRTADLSRLVNAGSEARLSAIQLPTGSVRFSASTGERVLAARTATGLRLVGEEGALRSLVVANSVARTRDFLASRGFQIDVARGRAGEVTLVGRNPDAKTVTVGVASTGQATVDSAGFKGRECEGFVRDLSTALEGTMTQFCPKPEYYGGAAVTVGQRERA